MNQRELLRALGVTGHQATIAIPFLWLTPATTDPDMVQVRLLVQALQSSLNRLGANVPVTGMLDVDSARELRRITGPNWPKQTWATIGQAVYRAQLSGVSLAPAPAAPVFAAPPGAVGFLDLPEIDTTTLLVAGAIGWWLWKSNKKRAS